MTFFCLFFDENNRFHLELFHLAKKALEKWKKVTFLEKMKKMTFFFKFGIR